MNKTINSLLFILLCIGIALDINIVTCDRVTWTWRATGLALLVIFIMSGIVDMSSRIDEIKDKLDKILKDKDKKEGDQ